MATRTSTKSGSWSDASVWDTGAPVDGDSVTIAAGHSVLMDVDLSAWTGLQAVTIQGSAGTPGMLYWKNGTSGYLKFRTSGTLVGTSGANRGRLLANSDGVWGNTGALAYADKAVIDLGQSGNIAQQYLDIAFYATDPTNWYVRTYGTKYDFTASGSTVDVDNDTIDLGVTPPAAGTAVMIASLGGTLPGGLDEHFLYYVRYVSGTKCKLAGVNNDNAVVDLTSTGSGALTIFTGYALGSATVNVLEDVTGDTPWSTVSGHNRAVLVGAAGATADVQRVTLNTIAAGTITFDQTVTAAKCPGARIYLGARNVSIRCAFTSTGAGMITMLSGTTHGGVFGGEYVCTNGTGTSYFGYALKSSGADFYNAVITGIVHSMYVAVQYMHDGTISGAVVGVAPSAGPNGTLGSSTDCQFSGHFAGIYYPDYYGVRNEFSGVVFGCTGICAGPSDGTKVSGLVTLCGSGPGGHSPVVTGKVFSTQSGGGIGGTNAYLAPTGVIAGCVYGMNCGGAGGTVAGTIRHSMRAIYQSCAVVLPSASLVANVWGVTLPAPGDTRPCRVRIYGATVSPSLTVERSVMASVLGEPAVFCEDLNGVSGAARAYYNGADVIKNTSVVRTGGAASSLEVIPISGLSLTRGPVRVFEWAEVNVPASAQTRTVYIKGEGWTVWPTAATLWMEADYLDSAGVTRTVTESTDVLTDNTTWTPFTVTFTPGAVGTVRYRVFLAAYQSASKIYVDNKWQ